MIRGKLNIREIASAVGVSTATVSRVINNKPDVKAATRAKVHEYLRQSNYAPRVTANDFRIIGFVNNFGRYHVTDFYASGIIDGVNERIHAHGFNTVLIHSDEIEREIRWPGQSKILNHLDGLIWSMPVFDEDFHALVKTRNLPCVVVNNLTPGVDMPLVESDNIDAGHQAVEYLVSLGHEKIGFIGGEMNLINIRDRYQGYLDGMAAHNLEINPAWVVDNASVIQEEGGIEAMHRIFARRNLPTAIIACNDSLALGIYRVAEERAIAIPEDLSVLSFDDSPVTQYLRPALTTFRQPLRQIGATAADLLTSMISRRANIPESKKIDVGMTLIIRNSVKALS